jgi:hypothetical protein
MKTEFVLWSDVEEALKRAKAISGNQDHIIGAESAIRYITETLTLQKQTIEGKI